MTRVLLCDDQQQSREGIRFVLSTAPEVEVVGEAEDAQHAVALARELAPEVVLMDVAMPGRDGIKATRQIVAENGEKVKVLAVSMHCDRRYVSAMLDAGASGYVLKSEIFGELKSAIHSVMATHTYLSPALGDIARHPDVCARHHCV